MQQVIQEFSESANPKSESQARRFKQRLSENWKNVTIISQPGKNDLVCSSHLQIGDALKTAVNLYESIETSKQLTPNEEHTTDESILHQAAAVLRKRL